MTVSPGTDVAVTELLATLAGLPGLLRACVFEVDTGTVCMTVGSDVAPPASLLARARQAHAASDGRADADDVIVTSSGAHHLLREVPAAAGDLLRTAVLWVYVELDGERADLSLARRRLAHATRHDGALAPPSSTFAPRGSEPPPPVATPALAMLPPLDESWGPIGAAARAAKARRAPTVAAPVIPAPVIPPPTIPPPTIPTQPSAPPSSVAAVPPPPAPASPAPPPPVPSPARSDPAPVAPPVQRAPEDPPSAPLPRRVPVMGRPLALLEPPTVPPPPPPGASPEPDDTTTETAVSAPPEEPEASAETDVEATTAEVAAAITHPMPARGHAAAPAPSLPAPRRPERPGGWDTDAGTLRRLMVTLRRLA